MKINIISFTDRGQHLAELLAAELKATSTRCGAGGGLREWAAEVFAISDALIYVGAAGICVRSIAPHIRSKTTDPAVVVVDETGKYAIPVLSGHLGGANDLARRIALITGGEAVITTATDRNNVFSVDAWARIQGCAVENPGKIKNISMKILDGQDIMIESDFPIEGAVPEHVILKRAESENAGTEHLRSGGREADAVLTIRRRGESISQKIENIPRKNEDICGSPDDKREMCDEDSNINPLRIIPRIVCAGVGCRKGIPVQNVENAIRAAFEEAGVSELSLCGIFSIDLKKEEAGLKEFCLRRKIPFETFSAEQLAALPGEFTASAFVRDVAGVDNVCERSASLGAETASVKQSEEASERDYSGTSIASGSSLILRKFVCEGVTVALAVREFHPDFRWTWG